METQYLRPERCGQQGSLAADEEGADGEAEHPCNDRDRGVDAVPVGRAEVADRADCGDHCIRGDHPQSERHEQEVARWRATRHGYGEEHEDLGLGPGDEC